ncbi:NAD(P)H-dependent flavin oxidoreductase [Bordetella pseudohinzii]|uniref:Nitronate monooxygenase n=2 Tax=Bordetella pseudohinzii TaxID=1331258 RepID=A0A0J6EV45_9BORD|nr:nitronate monooxygenase [Bordetella pseudohinzii]ANY15244.1 2-nitropropane dioxygenase [Bordetella pseudohinzii]KMM24315.1 2-nitropropane dioxygenase [Bordetella pseudohinzii]KXA77798.1 2-nitropropane dioxygenase [Bordetella pseudohinzii]KXA79516.1 2-nitropropane dioxygenase [Bordetella pseudohinzii]CUI49684.1 Nitronate monooxygenase [Bordetella pseudohinzii]
MNDFTSRLGLALPLVQAPMAGVSTPALAAAVSNAGGLGALGLGAGNAQAARKAIDETRALTSRPFAVNLFCHRPAVSDPAREAAWLRALAPRFAEFGAAPPAALKEIYTSFQTDEEMLQMLLETRPAVVSLHFGLPARKKLDALRAAGIYLMATATQPDEARRIAEAGVDAIVAQGIEAGGHRGTFDDTPRDERLGTLALTRLLAARLQRPVIAAGGIMDGGGIAAALALGAQAAQLGTAFISCPESSADAAYRQALLGHEHVATAFTRAISGRLARSVVNRFTEFGEAAGTPPAPDYPMTYDAGKALNAAAKAKGEHGYAAQWAGQAAALSRGLPAAELVAALAEEWRRAQASA